MMGISAPATYQKNRITRPVFGMLCFLAGSITTVVIEAVLFLLATEK
jgi:hypothetical protein